MSTFDLIGSILAVVAVLGLLFTGTFALLFLERFVHARGQHREGPGRGGKVDYFQVWKDYQKTKLKEDSVAARTLRFQAAILAWRGLPALFLLILLAGLVPAAAADTEIPLLLLLPFVAASLEASFLHASSDSRERYEWRRRLVLRVIGASVLALGFFGMALRAGSLSLEAISAAQSGFPYMAMFSSPGLFLCGIASFGAIFLFPGETPMHGDQGLSLTRSMHYLVFFVRKMWVLCLISFWVFVFFGGAESLLAKLLFPLKVAVALFAFTLLQGSVPRMRSSDSAELAARWLFRICFLGILLEAVWVGVFG